MTDDAENPTVYVVCQGMEHGEASMHDDMVVAVHSDKEAVDDITPATSMMPGEPVHDNVFFEAELDP